MQLTPEGEAQEQAAVDMLTVMMGGGVGLDEARRVLRKCKGDVQKAADAILEGDRGEEAPPSWPNTSESSQDIGYSDASTAVHQATQSSSSTIIDLTTDDSDFNTTSELRQAQNEVTFGPSERAPDAEWQMVTTTNTQTDTTQDDRSLNDAIQASLADFTSDELEMFPVEKNVREGGRPIALRAEASGLAHAALVMQALFHVPQVRNYIASLPLRATDPDVPHERNEDSERAILSLVELFTNLDLAQLSSIIDKEVLPVFVSVPWDGTTETLAETSSGFIKFFAEVIDHELNSQRAEDEEIRLFHFLHCTADFRDKQPRVRDMIRPACLVLVEIGDATTSNDLISRLTHSLTKPDGSGASTHEVISAPSEVVIFQLSIASEATPSIGKPPAELFSFPKYFFLDRFVLPNISAVKEKTILEHRIQAEINDLTKRKDFITRCDDRDTLKDLQGSIHYYENVADAKGDPDRHAAILRTTQKLRKITETIVSEVQDIDAKVEALQSEGKAVFDCPELQNLRYDLRAVLMHTGLPGRKQIYSYVQDAHGIWWKAMDYSVTEVPEETVLTDPTGLHLGAGPYFLIYSQHLPNEQMNRPTAWPKVFTDVVEVNNNTFLSLLEGKNASGAASVPSSITATSSSAPSLSFPFSPAVFPEIEVGQSMEVGEA